MMEPLYFGSAGHELFGMIYPADRMHELNAGVILCYPFGQEYIRCHRAYSALASRLSQAGLHVLKFDFYGSGDSAGNQEDASMEDWLANIHTAIAELKRSFSIDRVYLAGVRLGGTLAAIYSSQHYIDGLILWSPVIHGEMYMKELERLQRKWLSEAFARCRKKDKSEIENMGFVISDSLANQINAVNLLNLQYRENTAIYVVDGENSDGIEPLEAKLRMHAKFIKGEGYKFWFKVKGVKDQSMVPAATIKMITDLIAQDIRLPAMQRVFSKNATLD
ncbi:serine aminopeptidase domain-containing protein [Ohtaekwangia sp.]|uniref:serine aminopeptidase domain-containing protein n=1 Tax=Ohtaekwangia sp. TaxID=2066019 RepID=UPI002FDC88A8